jgi:hypothetical protein
MQFPTISTRKSAICSLHAALIWLVLGCTYVQAQESEESRTLVADQADDTTIVYGEEFFAQYPNAVSALDIINRIPAGQRIIQTGSNSARGFSANEDRILINGRRTIEFRGFRSIRRYRQ